MDRLGSNVPGQPRYLLLKETPAKGYSCGPSGPDFGPATVQRAGDFLYYDTQAAVFLADPDFSACERRIVPYIVRPLENRLQRGIGGLARDIL
jgi:hypothetical protein